MSCTRHGFWNSLDTRRSSDSKISDYFCATDDLQRYQTLYAHCATVEVVHPRALCPGLTGNCHDDYCLLFYFVQAIVNAFLRVSINTEIMAQDSSPALAFYGIFNSALRWLDAMSSNNGIAWWDSDGDDRGGLLNKCHKKGLQRMTQLRMESELS